MSEIFICSRCHEEHPITDCTRFDGESLCPDCLEEHTCICSHCGDRIWQDDSRCDALLYLGMDEVVPEIIQPQIGDILRIDGQGKIEKSSFQFLDDCYSFSPWLTFDALPRKRRSTHSHVTQQEYIQAIKTVAVFHGFEPDFIDGLITDGYTVDDIEDMIYCKRG